MVSTRSLVSTGIVSLMALSGADAFSPPRGHAIGTGRTSSSLHMAAPKGCAAVPFEKKKIAVFGAGGYLGAVLFGFLQRAGSLYGTGIAGISSPRAICSTGSSNEAINKVLAAGFKAAYAGEDLMRLVDIADVDNIKERVKGFDAAILGTTYELEQRTVTLGSYEKGPNDKTYEMYLDWKYGAWKREGDPTDDSDMHTAIFRNSVQACKDAGMSHLVVVETPKTVSPMDFLNILEEEDITYTYIRTASQLTKDKFYTFEKGISNKLGVTRLPAGSSLTSYYGTQKSEDDQAVYREDLAALIVQSLMSLDWGESRVLEVTPTPGSTITSGYGGKSKASQRLKFDKDWCPNSDLLGEVLSAL